MAEKDDQIERRVLGEVRMTAAPADGQPAVLTGHAAVFNTPADLGAFREQIAPGAFTDAIQTDDVRALIDHDSRLVLGRNRAGTLRLAEDQTGLAVEIDVPDTSYARDLVTSMKRGDITQMSFGFLALKESWDDTQDPPLRTLEKVQLFDVSPVTFPAYEETQVSVRARNRAGKIAKQSSIAARAARMRMRQAQSIRGIFKEIRGKALGSHLNKVIDAQVTESKTRTDIIEAMAAAAGISTSTVNQILSGSINCPPLNRLRGFASALGVSLKSLTDAAKGDGCNYAEKKCACKCTE